MKRVLIISYYWPPAGGISIIRPLKLAKYLRNSGWEPVICTAKKPHYPFEDNTAGLDLPKDIEIIKVPSSGHWVHADNPSFFIDKTINFLN